MLGSPHEASAPADRPRPRPLLLSLVAGSLWLGTHEDDSDFGAGFFLGLIAGGSLAFLALGTRRRAE